MRPFRVRKNVTKILGRLVWTVVSMLVYRQEISITGDEVKDVWIDEHLERHISLQVGILPITLIIHSTFRDCKFHASFTITYSSLLFVLSSVYFFLQIPCDSFLKYKIFLYISFFL